MKRAICCLVLVFALMAPGSSVSAAPLAFPDAKGDADGLDGKAAALSEPTLDIVAGRLSVVGPNLLYTIEMAKVAATPPTGSAFMFYFTYEGVVYYWNAYRDTVLFDQNATFFHSDNEDPVGDSPECGGCKLVVNVAAKTISISAPLTGLSRGIRQIDNDAKPLGPGAKFTGLKVLAMRNVVERERDLIPEDTITTTNAFTF